MANIFDHNFYLVMDRPLGLLYRRDPYVRDIILCFVAQHLTARPRQSHPMHGVEISSLTDEILVLALLDQVDFDEKVHAWRTYNLKKIEDVVAKGVVAPKCREH